MSRYQNESPEAIIDRLECDVNMLLQALGVPTDSKPYHVVPRIHAMIERGERAEHELGEAKAERHAAEVLGDEEHEAANDAHGVLADLCDILFGDPERASTQGYDGLVERAAALVDAEVSAHLRIRQCYDNTVTTAWRDAVAKAEAGRDKAKALQVAQAHAMWEANSENAVLRRQVAEMVAMLREVRGCIGVEHLPAPGVLEGIDALIDPWDETDALLAGIAEVSDAE